MSKLAPAKNAARYPRRTGLAGAVGAAALLVLGCGDAAGPGDAGGSEPPSVDAGRPDAGPEGLAMDSSGIWPSDAN